jgi:hypothetical protein
LLAVIALLAVAGSGLGCGGSSEERKGSHEIWFMGSIYDGASGAVLSGYSISLTYGPKTVNGTVDGNGRYTLGPLEAWNDYAVTVSLDGYRAFTSYNSGISPPPPPSVSGGATQTTTNVYADVYSANTTQTFDFDAYLFPLSVQPSPLTISIVTSDPNTPNPNGSIRLRPVSQPSIQDSVGGVGNQVWSNDQDMLAAVISSPFMDGSIMIDSASLVYGVNYQVAVYDVAGFMPVTGQTVRAGSQTSLIVNISTTASPLTIVSNTISMCRPAGQSTNVVMTAQISFKFNTSSIEDVTSVTLGRGGEVLDNALSVVTQMGGILKSNVLVNTPERGTSFVLSGDTLSIWWNPSVGLMNPSATDTIVAVTYGGLSTITLQPTGHPEFAKSLAALLNITANPTIVCGN